MDEEHKVTSLACSECDKSDDTVSYDFVYNLLLCDACYDELEDGPIDVD